MSENYYFECACEACNAKEEFLDYIKCPECKKDTCSTLATCSVCKSNFEIPDEVMNIADEARLLSNPSLETLGKIYKEASKFFAASHATMFQIRRHFLISLLDHQQLQQCIQIALEDAHAFTLIYGPYFPLVSVSLSYAFKCALHLEEQMTQDEINELGRRACQNLVVTHPGGEIYRKTQLDYRMWRAEVGLD